MTNRELVYFHKGLSYDAVSSLQQPGFLKTAQNVSFEVEGKQTLRQKFASMNTTVVGTIHSLKKFRSILVEADGTNLRSNNDSGDFTTRYSTFSSNTFSFRSYKDFLLGCNGADFWMMDLNHNLYSPIVANPITGPVLSDSGTGSGPSGKYTGYVTYLITWPNGHTYETGFSPASNDLTIVDNMIMWTNIPICPYTAYYGTAPTIHRKLYRGPGDGGTLTDIYYVMTITDNTDTDAEDSMNDTDLSAETVSYIDDYFPPIIPKYIEFHYGRMFMIDAVNIHRMYWSEAVGGDTGEENEVLMPFATLTDSWDDLRVSGFEYVDPQGLFSWGVNLYIPLKNTWLRKQGNDPANWAYRKTYATHGIGAPYTIDFCEKPGGIIGLTNPEYSEPGIAIFGGQESQIIASPRLDYIFNTHLNLDYISTCRGKVAGKQYHLLYPGGSSTSPDTYLCLDMRRYPDIRIANWTDLSGYSLDSDKQGKKFYIGTSTGYVKTQSDQGTCNILLETHDLIGGDPKVFNEQKTWTELKYSLNGTVTLNVWLDDIALKWPDDSTSQTLTGTNNIIQIIKFPPNTKGYKIRIKLTGTSLSTCEIYSPWQLLFDSIG